MLGLSNNSITQKEVIIMTTCSTQAFKYTSSPLTSRVSVDKCVYLSLECLSPSAD